MPATSKRPPISSRASSPTTPGADFAYYGLALLYAITGKTQDCLDSLTQAIELNPKNRLQARSDNDFQSMVDDPRFTELLYPELP